MSGFQPAITVFEAITSIRKTEYLLPAFQREFVWSPSQIKILFDSLMQDYPINSMLFWKVKGITKTEFRFYRFIDHFIERHKTHNEVMSTDISNDFHAILDGQQRLTALYIGLCGSYAYKGHRRQWKLNEDNFPTRHLYLNITKTYYIEEERDTKYNFDFIKKIDSQEQDLFNDRDGNKWFRVGKILSLPDTGGLKNFLEKNQIDGQSEEILTTLNSVVHTQKSISYYEEEDPKPDKAVNIFVRINAGGTHLSFSDILMSIAVANWKEKDARTEINGLIDNIRSEGFNIQKDFILKSFLYLYHREVHFAISSFNNEFIEKMESNWEKIRDAIKNMFNLFKVYGLTDYTLTSYNAALPILYYLYHRDIHKKFYEKIGYKEDRERIKKWLLTILLRRVFGKNTDTVLKKSRKAFTDNIEKQFITTNIPCFPEEAITAKLKQVPEMGDDEITDLLNEQHGSKYSSSILMLLYPNLDYKNNNFHQDHLHPMSAYEDLTQEDKEKYGKNVFNSILNLQMLDANENESKNNRPLKIWVEQETKDKDGDLEKFLNNHILPQDVDLGLDHFGEFIEKRKALLINKLKLILN